MANYRKSFNLRNGVQVDDSNFIVNANGLVGIGTSIPTEYFDLRGNAKIVGHTTSNTLYAGIATFGSIDVTGLGGASDIIVSGAISATSYYGDGSNLSNVFAISVDGWYVNSANSSISTSFKVGIGTTSPIYSLQIGNPISGDGVYVSSTTGDIYSTGTISAESFDGNLDASNLIGTIDNNRLPSTISVGIISASSGFFGNLSGIALTANSLTTTSDIVVNSINSGFSTSGISTVHNLLHVPGNLGIGTQFPNAQIHARKSGISSLQLTSDGSNPSIITFGRSVLLSNVAQFRFGNTNGSYPESTQQSLDVINFDIGNINFYLNPSGSGNGTFNWFNPSLSKIMTLTKNGNLGINSISPTQALSVVGNAQISGVATVGDLAITGSFNPNNITVSGNSLFYGKVGIATNSPVFTFQVGKNPYDANGGVGITSDGAIVAGILTTHLIRSDTYIGDASSLSGIVTTINAGSGISVDSTTGTVTITATGGGGGGESYWASTSAGIHTLSNVGVGTTNPQTALQVQNYGVKTGLGTFNASVGVANTIDSFNVSLTNYKSSEYTIHIENGSFIQAQKVLVMQNGTEAYSQEYAVMYNTELIVSVGATINSGNLEISVTPETGINGLTTYRFTRETVL